MEDAEGYYDNGNDNEWSVTSDNDNDGEGNDRNHDKYVKDNK
jgi:hypothetical protein